MPPNQSIDKIFISAIAKREGQERDQFLADACADDQVRTMVDRLLEAHFGVSSSFLEKPAAGIVRDDPLDATLGGDATNILSSHNRSVLKSLEKQLGTAPGVTLPGGDLDSNLAENPRSTEIPNNDSDNRYQLHGEIARGGMGAIIKGRDTDLGREVAVKVLLDAHKEKPEYIERFVEEAQIGGQLQHPGIVPVYELGQFEDQRPFFTMKLVKGKTLASLLSARKSPSEDIPKLLGIFEQICQTMAYAHTKGVIHRDLKPANIMVGAFGEVQVMDWGLSKVLQVGGRADEKRSQMQHREATVIRTRRSDGSDDLSDDVGSDTRHGSVMGTPAYMPPEQALGEVDMLGPQADVFGLGAILAEILTGKPPYIADDHTQVFRMATRGKLDDCFSRLDQSTTDKELVKITKHALAAEVDDRLPNAGQLASQIEDYQHGVQEELRKSEIERAEAIAREDDERRRKKLYVAIAALLLLVTSGIAVGYAIFAKQQQTIASRETELAEKARKEKEVAEERKAEAELLTKKEQIAAKRAKAIRMLSDSFRIQDDRPRTSTSLAIEAVKEARDLPERTTLSKAHGRLLEAVSKLSGEPLWDVPGRAKVPWLNENQQALVGKDTLQSTEFVKIVDLRASQPNRNWREFKGLSEYPRALSSDYKWAVTQGGDEPKDATADVWRLDWESARATLHCKLPMPEQTGFTATFSSDSKQLLTVFHEVKVWDLTSSDPASTGRKVAYFDTLRYYRGRSLISPDDRWAVAYGINGACVADILSNDQSNKPLRLNYQAVTANFAAAISPDSKWLALGTKDGTLLLNLKSDDWEGSVLRLPGVEIRDVAFSADSESLFTAGQSLRWFQLTAEDPASGHIRMHGDISQVNRLCVTQDGRWLASGHGDRTTRLWDLHALEETDFPRFTDSFGTHQSCLIVNGFSESYAPQVLRAHQEQVKAIRFTNDGTKLLTGGWDGHVHMWFVDENGTGNATTLRGHNGPIRCAAVSPDARWAATGSDDQTIRMWDLKSPSPARSCRVLHGFRDGVHHVHFSPNSRWLIASGGRNGWLRPTHDDVSEILVWDLHGLQKPPRVLSGLQSVVRHIVISKDSQWVGAKDQQEGTLRLWNILDEKRAPIDIEGRFMPIVEFRADGKSLVTAESKPGSGLGKIEEWRLDTSVQSHPKLLFEYEGERAYSIQERDGGLEVLIKQKDGAEILEFQGAGSSAKKTRSWKLPITKGVLRVPAVTVSSSGRYLGLFETAWDMSREQAAQQPLVSHPHSANVGWVAFGNSLYASAQEGGGVYLSELTADNVAETTIELSDGEVVAIAPDDSWLLSAQGRTAHLWQTDLDGLVENARQLVGRELTEAELREFYLGDF